MYDPNLVENDQLVFSPALSLDLHIYRQTFCKKNTFFSSGDPKVNISTKLRFDFLLSLYFLAFFKLLYKEKSKTIMRLIIILL